MGDDAFLIELGGLTILGPPVVGKSNDLELLREVAKTLKRRLIGE